MKHRAAAPSSRTEQIHDQIAMAKAIVFRVLAACITGVGRGEGRWPAPLQWRSPWWCWQLLSWALGTAAAPTLLAVAGLLLLDARCDYPAFWWSLPAIVAVGNAAAVIFTNQLRHRQPSVGAGALIRLHLASSMAVGCSLFLLAGWVSGFLWDVSSLEPFPWRAADPGLAAFSVDAALALGFGLFSFAHAGVLHASLAFRPARGGA